jgi:drug/metabolite transporter, DME family
MEIYFAFQAALCFSIAHIFIRRGLVESNAVAGSFISLTMTALLLCSLLAFFVPPSALWTPAIAIFVAAGIFAPGIGRTLSYLGIEKIGVAGSVPIVNSSPIFAFICAVIFLAEAWVLQNIMGTLLVITGVVTLSIVRPATGEWRKRDIVFPIIGAVAFGASAILRKTGLDFVPIPILAAAVTAASAALFSFGLLQIQGGTKAFQLSRKSAVWLFTARYFQYCGNAVSVLCS